MTRRWAPPIAAGLVLAACAACSWGGLQVTSRTPTPGASNVWVRDPVRAVFSAPVAPGSIDTASARIVTGDGAELARTATLSSDGRTLTLQLLDQPPLPAQLRVVLSSAIAGADGTRLSPTGAWSWTVPEWQRLGGVATTAVRFYPRPDLAASADGPVLVYVEPGTASTLRALSWDGASWAQLGGGIERDPAALTSHPGITVDADGAPVVVWTEMATTVSQLYASRWDGSTWSPLGGALNVDPGQSAIWHAVADGPGQPAALWWECPLSCFAYVKAWDGADWLLLGGAVAEASHPGGASLAVDASGRHHVVASEDDGDGPGLYVDRWDGAAWQRLGGPVNTTPGATPASSAIAVDHAGAPIVVWAERRSDDTWATLAKRWDGEDWVAIGGSLAVDASAYQGHHALAVTSEGAPVAAWYEYDTGGATPVSRLYAKRWDGQAWHALGEAVNDDRVESTLPPAIATWDEEQVLVAWTRARGDPDPLLDVIVGRFNELPPGPAAGD